MKMMIQRKILIMLFIVISVSVISYGFITYLFTYDRFLKDNLYIAEAAMEKAMLTVDEEIAEVDNIAKVFVTTDETISLLSNDDTVTDKHRDFAYLRGMAEGFALLKPNVEQILIANPEKSHYSFGYNNYIPADYDIRLEPWFSSFWNGDELVKTLPPGKNPHSFNYPLMSVIRKIRPLYYSTNIGIIRINFKIDGLYRVIESSIPSESYIYLADGEGNYLYSTLGELKDKNAGELSFSGEGEGEKVSVGGGSYYVIRRESEQSGLRAYLFIPEKYLTRHLPYIFRNMAASALICILLSIGLSMLLSYPFIRSIRNLAEGMNQIERGSLDYRVTVRSNDEIGYLTERFNSMADNLRHLIRVNGEIKTKALREELRVLQGQVTPHFLFNTLESIRMKALANQRDQVSYIIEELGELLRFNLRNRMDFVTLEKELYYIEKFINIYNSRLHRKIFLSLPGKGVTERILIPKFIIQPLIENAVKHGLELKEASRHIMVEIREESDFLWLSVEDDGCGISEPVVEELNRGFRENHQNYGDHIGLMNVNSRIKLLYGEECGLSLSSMEGVGTTVLIKFKSRPVFPYHDN